MAASAGAPITAPKGVSPIPGAEFRNRTHSSSTTLSSFDERASVGGGSDTSGTEADVERGVARFVTGPPTREHWKSYVRLDQTANFHPAGVISRVCLPCHRDFQSRLIPLKPAPPDDEGVDVEGDDQEVPLGKRYAYVTMVNDLSM
ncbi:hypothetical protein HK104_003562 [Borealophlyctis nickersoniae]|nr:hypothetical protein HK104_003562 [Borealophlyctis nickersoniae]